MMNPMQMMGQMMGGGPMGGMGGNPMMQLMQMMRGGGNPMQMLQSMAQGNPQVQQILDSVQGKNPQQLQQMARNLASERGVKLEDLAKQIGITPPNGGLK